MYPGGRCKPSSPVKLKNSTRNFIIKFFLSPAPELCCRPEQQLLEPGPCRASAAAERDGLAHRAADHEPADDRGQAAQRVPAGGSVQQLARDLQAGSVTALAGQSFSPLLA